ncbi:peptide/nickel transport system ATP-binding protein [Methanohalophilus levihalophilus]|uniref:ABC transporter ATP-binding protein n=1 Tax=Methanohalophilus levihalophilus TaxID=1431282 RepID=UPI001AEA19BA|nr:ABC transporter ATP-binding protein [Methanohalophilus levihalophilus]MBP2030789.1 peptide/nickel transport system ATP-binding protein [Methanohalophilus levihalophilus]
MNVLEVRNLSVGFITDHGDVKAVNDASFSIKEGETFGIIGESGSGKSVIGQSIMRLLPSNASVSGELTFEEKDLFSHDAGQMRQIRGKQISLIPQNPAGSLNPLLKNGIQISEVFEIIGVGKREGMKLVTDMMGKLLLKNPEKLLRLYPHELSGGMKQRLLATMCLSYKPKLVIADEPTKGLDSGARAGSLDLFRHMKDDHGYSMLLITHDLDFALEICDRVAVMYAGEIVEIGSASKVLHNPSHPYTKGLLKALPRNGLIPLEGQTPSRIDLPPGCLFSRRCGHSSDRCHAERPDIRDFNGGTVRCHLY